MAERTRELLPELEVLLAQYRSAMELYRHEDSLNWRKLNNLLYVNISLAAVVGFLMQSEPRFTVLTPKGLMVLSCSIGLFVCVGFFVALWRGTRYLGERKRAVIRVENQLIEGYGGTHVATHPEEDHHIEKRSATQVVLRLAPIFFGVLWFWLLVASLLA